MVENIFYHRHIVPRLTEALEDSPVVLIYGPRQCGKTTFAQYYYAPKHLPQGSNKLTWGDQSLTWGTSNHHRDYSYISFDDGVARDSARSDPYGFVADLPERVILDEVQLVPELFPVIKMNVDRHGTNGRFILTGSTNVLLVPLLSESLVGRMQTIRLHPLAQYELVNKPTDTQSNSESGFLRMLFQDGFRFWQTERLGKRLMEQIVTGGYPRALMRSTSKRQADWYRNYVDTLVQQDVRDMTKIRSIDILPLLMTAACSQTATLYNLAALAAPFQLSRPTISEYLRLLERFFLLEWLPPWYNNRLKRLVKTPKLHVGDTGLAAALLGVGVHALLADRVLLGRLLETFVFQELRRQASWYDMPVEFFHFRDRDGVEVDIVMEGDSGSVAGVEIKAAASVTSRDFRGLRKLAQTTGKRFQRGVVLYDGEISVPYGDRLHAVPIRQLWETTRSSSPILKSRPPKITNWKPALTDFPW